MQDNYNAIRESIQMTLKVELDQLGRADGFLAKSPVVGRIIIQKQVAMHVSVIGA